MSNVDTFIAKVKSQNPHSVEEKKELNDEFATIKASLPEDQKADAETRVRTVLPA